MKIWYRKFRYKTIRHLVKALTSKTSDSAIAFGFAIGTFIALLPTPGLNWILAFCAALIYKKINKLSVLFAVVFWNPLFVAPVYGLCFVVGDIIFNVFHLSQWETLLQHSFMSNSGKFLAGNLILTPILSFISYQLAIKVISLYKNRRKMKHSRKKNTNSTLLLMRSNAKVF